ncbi:MAG TPA: DUF1015 domain-containing protein [Tepidisphaeraceae bacterium]
MAEIRPFAALRYDPTRFGDLSDVLAPPYDVLDAAGKAKLQARSPYNIVGVDLPYLPPKAVGPDAVYADAARTIADWTSAGVLKADALPAIYAYSQSFTVRGRTFDRRGMIALVRIEEFSTPAATTQVVPHEKTYKGPIEDRMKLMQATGLQLSPIFGLFPDEGGALTGELYSGLDQPQAAGTLDGVTSRIWPVTDPAKTTAIVGAMRSKKIYIADGHHRYTTALGYKKALEAQLGHALPADHPANFCLFVLVSMHDEGCVILPTHRLVGGLSGFDVAALEAKLSGAFAVSEIPGDPSAMPAFEDGLATAPAGTFGLYDGATKKMYTLTLTKPDLLAEFEPGQSPAWRSLDVAILRRYLLDEIIAPAFAGGKEPTLGYTADPTQIAGAVDGTAYQIALLLRPTPLQALIDLGEHGEVMPQKSTYFYPKLATGVVMNPIA